MSNRCLMGVWGWSGGIEGGGGPQGASRGCLGGVYLMCVCWDV